MGVLLKHVASEARTTKPNEKSGFSLSNTEVSAQEAVYRLLPIQIKQLSHFTVNANKYYCSI